MSKALCFLQITAKHQDCPFFTVFLTIKTLSQNISYIFRLNFTNVETAIGGKSSRERFWRNSSQCRDILLHLKVARYSLTWSIPPKFEHKLRRHKQRFGKTATTAVLDKDKICYDQGCIDIEVVIATE